MGKHEANTMEAIIPITENRTMSLSLFPDLLKNQHGSCCICKRSYFYLVPQSGELGLRGEKGRRGQGWLGWTIFLSRPRLTELLFIFLIFRGRPMTAEEDCICRGAA